MKNVMSLLRDAAITSFGEKYIDIQIFKTNIQDRHDEVIVCIRNAGYRCEELND